MSEVRSCRHVGCGCPATATSDYCSAECAKEARGDIARSPCACGHASCQTGRADEGGRAGEGGRADEG
jgi:hypothetical protein